MEKAGICRYYQKGNCRLRGNCPYVHRKQMKPKCKFFMEGHCKFGDNCNFYHPPKVQHEPEHIPEIQQKKVELPKQEIPKEPTVQKPIDRQDKVRAINSILGLGNTEKQAQKLPEEPQVNYARRILVSFTDLARSPEGKQNIERINVQVYKKPYLEYLKELTDPLLREQAQIMRRYQYSFTTISDNLFTVKISPIIDSKQMKLSFDIEQKCLVLSGSLRPPKLQIVNKSIPEYFRKELNEQLSALLKTRTPYETLKYLENYFEQVTEKADFILENRRFCEKDLEGGFDGGCEEVEEEDGEEGLGQWAGEGEGEEKGRAPVGDLAKQVEKPKRDEDEEEEEEKEQGETKQKLPAKEERKQQAQKPPTQSSAPQCEIPAQIELPISVTLQTLQTNCESLILQELLIHLVCSCSAMITFSVKAKGKKPLPISSRLKCLKCRQLIVVYTKRQILHRGNNSKLADMAVINARLEDVGAIAWKVNCECENVIVGDQLALSGVKKIVKCFECFKEYFILYYGLFAGLEDRPQAKGPKIQRIKTSNQVKFKLDSELPNKGTCKHYKYSFRWLRFQCCGRAFACDKCHEDNTERHDYDRAEIMICGMCSFEQPVQVNCRRCKKEVVKGTEKSGHWEGGKGCRNQAMLSKNDSKKYTGMNKTQASKHGSNPNK